MVEVDGPEPPLVVAAVEDLSANRIIPAQVPNTGSPSANASASGPNSPEDSNSSESVVDSPPG